MKYLVPLVLVATVATLAGDVSAFVPDGTVRFISNSVTPGVWLALGTRAGSESVTLP